MLLSGVFGETEAEVASEDILRLCQKKGSWATGFGYDSMTSDMARAGFLSLLCWQYIFRVPPEKLTFYVNRTWIEAIEAKTGIKLADPEGDLDLLLQRKLNIFSSMLSQPTKEDVHES